MTVKELFLSSVNNFTDKTAIVENDNRISYGELGQMVENFSSFLVSTGIKKGDAVSILLPNSIEFITAFFSIANIGAVSVPINTSYKKEEISYYVKHSSSNMILTQYSLAHLAEELSSDIDCSFAVVMGDSVDWNTDSALSKSLTDIPFSPDDEAIYLYSTGSTGTPKRVSRTHGNLVALADNHTATVSWTEEDRILFTVPISHTYGFGNFISAVKIGATIFVVKDFNRNGVLNLIEKESITIFPAVPVMLDVLAKTYMPEPKDLSSLKLVISAGGPLPEKTFQSFHEKFGIYPRQLYGSSETGVISINLGDDIEKTYNSVGRHVKNVTVEIRDESGGLLGVDEVGEIAVKSPSMTTTGYYGLPEETDAVFKDGYYLTGDLGRIDEDGFIYIVGRKKLFINISGNKVDPVEVENVLLEHGSIKEAAVLGITDNDGSESVKAVIVNDSELKKEDIIKYCRDRIAGFKIPQIIEFRNDLPRSPTGKVLREQLK